VELASRSLEEKAEQLQLISKYKSEFLANMSHELRTPLNSLLILSKTLAENRGRNLTGEQVKFAETVYSSGNDLLQLINEILDLSKVEAGKMPIDPRTFPLDDVRDYIERTFRHIAEQKGLAFEVHMGERLPASMFSDPTRLQQILKNLLSNAFKFTAQGGVTMVVEPTADETRSIRFSVQDTGIGIPLDKHKLIFEAFQQADGTTSRKYGGTGLGLTISREMARLLGGVIEVKSAPGQGSTFTLRLPASYAGADAVAREDSRTHETAPEPHVPPLPADADFSGHKVLLVDDDGRNVFAISSVLKDRGMEVLHAQNGKIALDLLRKHDDISAVLMDTMMPEMDGLDATRAIRGLAQFQALPIISLTAKAMKGDREKALAAGASEYVTKPVDPERLLAILHVWLPRKAAVGEN
jgi:CheY-like chemotaxis protein